MSVFQDKKYENLDWLSQAMQPIDSPLNTVLASLPDIIDVDIDTLKAHLGGSDTFSMSHLIVSLVHSIPEAKNLSWEDRDSLKQCFEITVSDNTIVNFEENAIDGEIKIVKTVFTFEDQDLQKMMGKLGISELRYLNRGASATRLNEILELVGGCEEAISSRSMKKKIVALRVRMQNIFSKNEWNIKDTELANKLCIWAKRYVEDGTISGLTNFCKVKILTYSGNPIYSIVEDI